MRSSSTIATKLSSWTPLLFLLCSAGRVHSTLVRRAEHSSTVVGDYIYVDGGQFSQIVDDDYLLNIETHTLSIPLDRSWSPADVHINILNKTAGAPLLNNAKIWTSPGAQGFYSYGGEVSSLWQRAVPPRALWNFTVDGKGGGSWADQTKIAGNAFNELLRSADGASDVLGSTAYYLGGVSSRISDPIETGASDDQTAISGLVSFNMGTGIWENGTTAYAGTGKSTNASMVHVPQFGTEGLMVVIGGTSIGAEGEDTPYVSFGNISIFDPSSNSWHSQTATGAIPEEREKFCVVGVGAADSSSYEIFMYGGARITPTQNATWTTINHDLDEVFVLSLPKFEWVKADYPSNRNRYSHTCHVAGNRQMISIGGIDGTDLSLDGYNITDPFLQTIGVFDLTEMTWVDKFTHDAAPYEQPAAVEALYSNSNPFPSTWSSPSVQNLFTTTNSASTPPPPPASPSPPAKPDTHSTSMNLSTGALVGAIISCITILALTTGLLIWLYRRHKQTQQDKNLWDTSSFASSLKNRRRSSRSSHFSIMHDQISRPIPIAQVYTLDNNSWMKLGMGMSMRSKMESPIEWEPCELRGGFGFGYGEGLGVSDFDVEAGFGLGGISPSASEIDVASRNMGNISPFSREIDVGYESPKLGSGWNGKVLGDGLPRAL